MDVVLKGTGHKIRASTFQKKTQPFGWALFFRSPLLPGSFRSLASLIIPPETFYPFSLLIRFAGSEIFILQCFFDLKTLFCHRTYLLLKLLEVYPTIFTFEA
jgi:hypothetical protein